MGQDGMGCCEGCGQGWIEGFDVQKRPWYTFEGSAEELGLRVTDYFEIDIVVWLAAWYKNFTAPCDGNRSDQLHPRRHCSHRAMSIAASGL
jgi:hypothetical protein